MFVGKYVPSRGADGSLSWMPKSIVYYMIENTPNPRTWIHVVKLYLLLNTVLYKHYFACFTKSLFIIHIHI